MRLSYKSGQSLFYMFVYMDRPRVVPSNIIAHYEL